MASLAGTINVMGRNVEAEESLRQILAIEERIFGTDHESTLRTMTNLANSIDRQRRYEEAIELDRKILDMCVRRYGEEFPLTTFVKDQLSCHLANLARFLATTPDTETRDPERSLAAGHEAVSLCPDSRHALNNYCIALYRTGKYEEALTAFERSNELLRSTEEMVHRPFYAMSHWRLGHKEEAQSQYQSYVRWYFQTERSEDDQRFLAEMEGTMGLTTEDRRRQLHNPNDGAARDSPREEVANGSVEAVDLESDMTKQLIGN